MTTFNFVLLYVDNPRASADFYAGLFGRPPIETADTFCMLPLSESVMLGLWGRGGVEPTPSGGPGASEIAFTVESKRAVEQTYTDWTRRGIRIAQKPTSMDFGDTFVALDPDGHRIRVFAPAG